MCDPAAKLYSMDRHAEWADDARERRRQMDGAASSAVVIDAPHVGEGCAGSAGRDALAAANLLQRMRALRILRACTLVGVRRMEEGVWDVAAALCYQAVPPVSPWRWTSLGVCSPMHWMDRLLDSYYINICDTLSKPFA